MWPGLKTAVAPWSDLLCWLAQRDLFCLWWLLGKAVSHRAVGKVKVVICLEAAARIRFAGSVRWCCVELGGTLNLPPLAGAPEAENNGVHEACGQEERIRILEGTLLAQLNACRR